MVRVWRASIRRVERVKRWTELTKASLTSEQLRIVELIESLNFGRVEGIRIRRGEPCSTPVPRIVEEIKLDSDPSAAPESVDPRLTLREEFVRLFRELTRLHDSEVTIFVRHHLPARLMADREQRKERL
jgi:hypothetical protein